MTLKLGAQNVLADTSVWVEHFRRRSSDIAQLIESDALVLHEFVLGELMLGTLARGHPAIEHLSAYPIVPTAPHDEVVELVRRHRLEGSGIGWVDVHLVAAALLGRAHLLTRDAALHAVAHKLGLSPA